MELEAAGIQVDRLAGASLGSIVAATYARGFDAQTAVDLCYEEFVRSNPYNDYTIPTVSLVKGRRTERALRRRLTGIHIEELPRTFRCVSTDLQTRAPYVHRTGDLTSAVMSLAQHPRACSRRVRTVRDCWSTGESSTTFPCTCSPSVTRVRSSP